jgi:hypothetical protein
MNNVSNFDPASFMDATVTEAMTKRPPIPAGRDVIGIIGEPKIRTWQGKKDPTQSGIAADIPIEIDLTAYPDLHKIVGADKVTLVDSIMLDTTEGGMIDTAPGKNGKLRRYREALGMNSPGTPFSFRAMQGRQIKAKIKHETYEGELYDKVDAVAKP